MDTLIGPLQDPVKWCKITHAGEQVAQWDFQNKGRSSWTSTSLHFFWSPTVQLSHQHVWFCTIRPDRAKGLINFSHLRNNLSSNIWITTLILKYPSSLYLVPRKEKLHLNSLFLSLSYICFKKKLDIPIFVTGILSGLVGITGKLNDVRVTHGNIVDIYVIHRPWSVRIGKNCARGLEYGPRPQASGRTRDKGHSFSQYGPTKAGE